MIMSVLGDPNVQTSEFSEAVMINTDTNPFDLIKKSVRFVAEFRHSILIWEPVKMIYF